MLRLKSLIATCVVVLSIVHSSTVMSAEPVPGALVRGIKVQPDKAPDCTSLKSIVESVTRDCETNDQKAIAIYNFMRMTHYHRAYPSEPGGIPVLKEIHCYGWSLCGGLHAEQSALWREMGWDWRFVGWPGHTTVEAKYDGRWHYLDVFLKFYAWMPDPQNPERQIIAGEDDLAEHPQELLRDAFVFDDDRKVWYAKGNEFDLFGKRANWQAPAFLVCGDGLNDIATALQRRNRVGPSNGWGGIQHASGDYSAEINLAPGFSLTNTWTKAPGAWYWNGSQVEPCHTCGDKEIRNSPEKGPVVEPYLGKDWSAESYANGSLEFTPHLLNDACLSSFAEVHNVAWKRGTLVAADDSQPAWVVVRLQSPYIFTRGEGSAKGLAKFEISIDQGKTWKEAQIADYGATIAGQTEVLARLTIADRLQDIHLSTVVQNNPFALPYLSPGKNVVAVDVADREALGKNQLVVTYVYHPGARHKNFEQLFLERKEIARAHDASWNAKPTVVRKTFVASDLPAKFEIDIPTPAGMQPVYPRMVYVSREILAAGQEPSPLPFETESPMRHAGDQLISLPNPLLTGTKPPPARAKRAVSTRKIELVPGHFVAQNGDVPTSDFLKWPKTKGESFEPMAFLIGGDLKDLPSLENLAGARLVVPINAAHDKAPTKIGVTALRKPFVADKPFDFRELGDVVATAVVPLLPANERAWSPPKEIKLDVTRQFRAIALGEASFNGFAVRVVPDRSVDDGWTVRVHLPKEPAIYLEVDTYSAAE